MMTTERIALRHKELGEARKRAIADFEGTVPLAWRPYYLLCKGRRGTIQEAVKLHCLICRFWDDDAVAGCQDFACPLFEFRPFQGGAMPAVTPSAPLRDVLARPKSEGKQP